VQREFVITPLLGSHSIFPNSALNVLLKTYIKEERTLKENKKTHDYGIRNSRFNFKKFNTQ
jgi:hypothetical protein